jgi:hypothetical protein
MVWLVVAVMVMAVVVVSFVVIIPWFEAGGF